MKRRRLHSGSFIAGLLVGVVALLVIGLALTPAYGKNTSQSFKNKSQQLERTTSQTVAKTWKEFLVGMNTDKRKITTFIDRTVTKDFHGVGVTFRGPSLQPCAWFAYLDQTLVHWAERIGIHARTWTPSPC